MPDELIIDGNNLLHAMHAHAPLPNVGRETLVRIVGNWIADQDLRTTIVFDGPPPRSGLGQQMAATHVDVRYSAPQTADDVIVAMIGATKDPGRVRVVTSDKAIRLEARYHRCRDIDSDCFVSELFAKRDTANPTSASEDPIDTQTMDDTNWLELFGLNDDDTEPFDGSDAMQP